MRDDFPVKRKMLMFALAVVIRDSSFGTVNVHFVCAQGSHCTVIRNVTVLCTV